MPPNPCYPGRPAYKRKLLACLAVPLAPLFALALAGAQSGCAGAGGSGRPTLTVFAAASLQGAFGRYAERFGGARVRLSFAGSDALAAQIEQGLHPDVFASADAALPQRLHAEGLLQKPVLFAANRLVLAVPASSHAIDGLASIERPGVTLAIGEPGVPVGAYARKLIARLPPDQGKAILANAADVEPDVSGIVGKLTEGAVDAGFVYVTDVAAAGGRLRAIDLPAALSPQVAYAAAVVRGSRDARQARAFLDGLLHGAGRRDLLEAGFAG